MRKQLKLYGITVLCYEDGPHGRELCHKQHFITTDRDSVLKLALDYIYDVQLIYADTTMIRRSVMSYKEQFRQS